MAPLHIPHLTTLLFACNCTSLPSLDIAHNCTADQFTQLDLTAPKSTGAHFTQPHFTPLKYLGTFTVQGVLVTEYLSGGELFSRCSRRDYRFTESKCKVLSSAAVLLYSTLYSTGVQWPPPESPCLHPQPGNYPPRRQARERHVLQVSHPLVLELFKWFQWLFHH
mgnify:CR=1 FL=1